MNISLRTTTNSILPSYSPSSSSCAFEERMNRRLDEIDDSEKIFVRQGKMMSSSCSSDSLLRAKEVLAQARSQRRTSSSPSNSKRRRNTSYEPHAPAATTTSTRQQRKEKETAMLLEEIMIVKQKILTEMKNTKTPNADRDSCIQSFLQACDTFARAHEFNSTTENKDRSARSSARREERKTRVKFDLSRNEVFLF